MCGSIVLCDIHMLKSIFWEGAPTSIESLSPLCFVPCCCTSMSHRDMSKAQDKSWVKESAARLRHMQQQVDHGHDGSTISNEAWERVATQPLSVMCIGADHTESRGAPLSGQETAELVYNMSGEAFTHHEHLQPLEADLHDMWSSSADATCFFDL